MRTIKFVVSGQTVARDPDCDFTGLVAGSIGYLHAAFRTDRAWKGCKVAASFWRGGKEYAVALKDGVCLIPSEALTGHVVGVSLTGIRTGYRIETNRVYFKQEVHRHGNG